MAVAVGSVEEWWIDLEENEPSLTGGAPGVWASGRGERIRLFGCDFVEGAIRRND